MAQTKSFTNHSNKIILVKNTMLFLVVFFLSTMSYAQIFTGKLLLFGNDYTVNFKENTIQDIDALSSTKPNEPLLLTEEVSNNLKAYFFKKSISEEFKVLKINQVSSDLFINGLVFKSGKNKNSTSRKKLKKPLNIDTPKKVMELSSEKKTTKFTPMLVVFNL